MAEVLVAHGRPVTLCADDHWAGVWDLERLTDEEAASWGLWVAMKARPFTRPRREQDRST